LIVDNFAALQIITLNYSLCKQGNIIKSELTVVF